jgi:small subunit ribosomal protein S15
MPLTKEVTSEIVKKFQSADKDTGSSEVQIALFTQRVNDLTEHLKIHKKDHHTRRGLITLINKRNKLLKYVYNQDHGRYRKIVEELGIRAKYDRHRG